VVAASALVLVLTVQWLFGDEIVRFAADLLRGADRISPGPASVVVAATWLLAAVLAGGAFVAVVVHRRWRAAGTVAAAGTAAAAVGALLSAWNEPSADAVVHAAEWVDGAVEAATATEILLAAAAAMVTAAAPWVPRRWRRLGWALVVGLVLTRALATPIALSSLRAVLTGWVVGAAVVVALGGPARRPRGAAVADGMARVGVPLRRLEQASLDARGSTPYFAVARDGRRLFVKTLGQDERSADLLFRMYRTALPRDLGDERGYLSLRRAVEHEALLALAARDQGARTPRFVALAPAEPDGFVLAYEAIDGRSLDRVDPAEVDDRVLDGIWAQVALLRSRGIAHRDLRLANIFLAADGDVWIIDFGFSELAASDTLLATDVAELLASSSLQVGTDRAVRAAVAALGPAAVRTAHERLRPWALAGATRAAYKARPGLLDELQRAVATL
jgi:undecaprenyl-diphosphatase